MKTLSVVSLIKLTERVKKKKGKKKSFTNKILCLLFVFVFISGLICFFFSFKENVYTLKFKRRKRVNKPFMYNIFRARY